MQDHKDANVRSMLGSLALSVKNPKGAAAKADAIPPPPKPSTEPPAPDPKGLAAAPAPPKAETPGVPAPNFPPRARSKAKSKAKSISDEEKAKIPCIFHRMPNGCMRVGATASIVMKTRRMVACQRASRKERMLLPKAKVVRLQRQW